VLALHRAIYLTGDGEEGRGKRRRDLPSGLGHRIGGMGLVSTTALGGIILMPNALSLHHHVLEPMLYLPLLTQQATYRKLRPQETTINRRLGEIDLHKKCLVFFGQS
jgi:hypothetical protein